MKQSYLCSILTPFLLIMGAMLSIGLSILMIPMIVLGVYMIRRKIKQTLDASTHAQMFSTEQEESGRIIEGEYSVINKS